MILCTAFISPATFAGDDSITSHIHNTLNLLFKITDSGNLINANDYQQITFVYNGMPVTAFKNKTSGWLGFFKKLAVDDLPGNAVSSITTKYKNCKIKNVIMYFNSQADLYYFAEIILNNKCIVLKIQPSGHVQVFN